MGIFGFIIALSIIIFIHELGHFLVARFFGLRVATFSIGFGPSLLSFYDRYNTKWQVAAIPLGGFVSMEEDGVNLLMTCPPYQKILIALAGPFMNFVLAFSSLSFLYAVFGYMVATPQMNIIEVVKDTPAFYAGLQKDDVIIKIADTNVEKFETIGEKVSVYAGRDMPIVVKRGNQETPLTIKLYDYANKPLDKMGIMTKVDISFEKKSFSDAIILAGKTIGEWVFAIWVAIKNLITPDGQKNISGIISISKMAKQTFESGVYAFVMFLSIISVNLGFLNIMPIPVLDGGHIMIGLIEMITGRRLNKRVMDVIFTIGFLLLIALMVRATLNDILGLGWFG